MGVHTATISSKLEIAQNILELKLSMDKDMEFQAGQFIMIDIPNFGKRSYSIISLKKKKLVFAIKIQSESSKMLATLPVGAPLNILGPFGRFVANPSRKMILIGGGIGITPLYSMIHAGNKSQMSLHYVSPTKKSMAYLKEITAMNELDYKIYLTKERTQLNNKFLQRRPTVDDIINGERYEDDKQPLFYICGPVKMIESLTNDLIEKDIHEKNILSENFVKNG